MTKIKIIDNPRIGGTMIFSLAFAATIVDMGSTIEIRESWNEAIRREIQKEKVIEAILQDIVLSLAKSKVSSPFLKPMAKSVKTISEKIAEIQNDFEFQKKANEGRIDQYDFIPTAFFGFVGGQGGLGSGGSASVKIGVGPLILPQIVHVIDKKTLKLKRVIPKLDVSWIGFPLVGAGAGAGGNAGIEGGFGAVWGSLDRASDFSGFGAFGGGYLGLDSVAAGLSLDFRLGAMLKSESQPVKNLVAMISIGKGISAKASGEFSGTWIFQGKQLLNFFMPESQISNSKTSKLEIEPAVEDFIVVPNGQKTCVYQPNGVFIGCD